MSHFSNKLLAFAFFSSIFLFFLFSLISTMSTRSFPGVCPDCATGKEVQEQDQGPAPRPPPPSSPPRLNSAHTCRSGRHPFIPHSSPAAASEPRVHPSLFPPSVKDGVSSEPRGQPTTPFDCLFSSKKATFQEFLLLASFPKPHGPFPASRGGSLLPAPPPTARCSAHAHAWGPRARRRLPQPHSLRTAHSHLSCHLHTH